MNNENEEIKSQVINQQVGTTQSQKDEVKNQQKQTEKFKQKKVRKQKSKVKTWKKVLWSIIITLILGVIGGGIGLYMLQDKTDFWFIVPSTLTRKQDENSSNNTAATNKSSNNVSEQKQQENKLLTMDEAYQKLNELYKVSTEIYLNYPASYFTVDKESHPTTSTSAVELIDYDKIINKYFTKSEKADYEEASVGALIEENDKVYVEAVNGNLGLDYLDKVFTKIEIAENEIKCEVINLYNGSFDNMKVTSDGTITIDTMKMNLKQVKSKFVIKKVNDTWKVDEFDYNGMR